MGFTGAKPQNTSSSLEFDFYASVSRHFIPDGSVESLSKGYDDAARGVVGLDSFPCPALESQGARSCGMAYAYICALEPRTNSRRLLEIPHS